jgi:hypothetical protein
MRATSILHFAGPFKFVSTLAIALNSKPSLEIKDGEENLEVFPKYRA